ncbi:6-phosphogluconolactonase [Paenibacillus shirakamiensis]|uniref:6-phosphogluconolactonase n=1 Tax=Paenibacillus shirakamiensis TaxID=1265935 RepID=A0ABS4JKS6_9BACL|nr:lactonase family protein [Paenibacillus shirakamiensis]MBP2001209.1 6-phosphogluconolactonase [Paenibacillus shirakamiensis]
MSQQQDRQLLFVGSYAEAEGPGVYTYELNQNTGELKELDQVSGLKNPTFLNVDAAKHRLYAIGETVAEDTKAGEAVAFTFDETSGILTEISRELNLHATTCHINRDQDHSFLVVAAYHGGQVGLIGLNADGTLGALLDMKQHTGHGVDPERQDKPHVHSAWFSPDEKYVLVCDLGLDIVRIYALDRTKGELVFHKDAVLPPGSGPRHLAFHPQGDKVYVINEVNSTIAAFTYEANAGELTLQQVVSTLPDGFQGENGTAEIAVSSDGRYVYGSNRGHDSIVLFEVEPEDGQLKLVEHVSSEGGHPRHFTLTPSGEWMIVANRDSNNLAVFKVDTKTGKLAFTGLTAQVSKPVCVKPLLNYN